MKILLVEDDIIARHGIEMFLTSCCYNITSVSNGKEALDILSKEMNDLVITDLQMPVMDGFELLKSIKENNLPVPAIVITAYASIENAVEAMQKGAEDFLTKPVNLSELKIKIEKITQKLNLIDENKKLRYKLDQILFPEIITISEKMSNVKKIIEKVANDPDVSVMIYGESGTGKELVAKNIHSKSCRNDFSFITINCAALPEDLLESELFGYSKGAFTGALKDKIGNFQAADKGTIFLDEVSEMSPRLQAKLLRVLQEHEIQPVGSTAKINLDVRVIGASNVNLKELVKTGKFREDLFYRLNVVEINLPPLKERTEDIPLLISHFLDEKRKIEFSNKAIDILKKYSWPGNIRELKNFIKMLEVISDKKTITEFDLPPEILCEVNSFSSEIEKIINISDYRNALNKAVENFEKNYLMVHLNKNEGNISKTADSIGLSRVSLHKKIKEYNLSSL